MVLRKRDLLIFSRGGYESMENSSDSRKRNAGIGLAVCETIIKAHGGMIGAESKKSGGAVFRFVLDKEETTDDEQ